MLLFAREVIANPRGVGAACPSSIHLASAMAAQVDRSEPGLVVELGGGTGNITRALLRQGVLPGRLVTIERSPALAAHLRRKFPGIRVIDGDASQLTQLLGGDARNVHAVVSGLPLRSLPRPTVAAILQQVHGLLDSGGIFVQFTYDLRASTLARGHRMTHTGSKIVWKNVPPARVDVFRRQAVPSKPLNVSNHPHWDETLRAG